MSARIPAILFGHGNPMNALLRNPYTRARNFAFTNTSNWLALRAQCAMWPT